MKASREVKRLIAIARRLHGKKNGVIGNWFFDRAEFLWRAGKERQRHLSRSKFTATGDDNG